MTRPSTEDKKEWVIFGARFEDRFVERIAPLLGLAAEINPAKARSPYAADLIVNGRVADLKHQSTPFFTAARYGIPPQRAVTFNRKDYERYSRLYPEIDIYFWVAWLKTSRQIGQQLYTVRPMRGVYRAPFSLLARKIAQGQPLHPYQRRQGDTAGNAKDSYVFDLAEFEELFCTYKIGGQHGAGAQPLQEDHPDARGWRNQDPGYQVPGYPAR